MYPQPHTPGFRRVSGEASAAAGSRLWHDPLRRARVRIVTSRHLVSVSQLLGGVFWWSSAWRVERQCWRGT